MSTRATLHIGEQDGWAIEEEMLHEETHLLVTNPTISLFSDRIFQKWDTRVEVDLVLRPEVIEAIVRLHGERKFLHQNAAAHSRAAQGEKP